MTAPQLGKLFVQLNALVATIPSRGHDAVRSQLLFDDLAGPIAAELHLQLAHALGVARISEDPQDGVPDLVLRRPLRSEIDRKPAVITASVDILERVGPLALVMAAAAASDEQVKKVVEVGEQRRVEGFTVVAEKLARRGKLRRGVTIRRAADILLTILSAETHQQLTARRNWSSAECRRWFQDVLEQQLLA